MVSPFAQNAMSFQLKCQRPGLAKISKKFRITVGLKREDRINYKGDWGWSTDDTIGGVSLF